MNKELIVLPDDKILIRNESGEYEKREYVNNSKEILLQENKIEIVTNQMNSLKKEIEKQTAMNIIKIDLVAKGIHMNEE